MSRFPEWTITAAELAPLLKNQEVKLLDVREPEEFEESHIVPCQLIPLGEVMGRVESELNKEDAIVIYCAHGVRSMYALRAMQTLGFKNLKSLEGGIVAWDEYQSSL